MKIRDGYKSWHWTTPESSLRAHISRRSQPVCGDYSETWAMICLAVVMLVLAFSALLGGV